MSTISPRRRILRWLGRSILLLIACYLAVFLYTQLSSRLMRYRAENLLTVMRGLQINKSTWSELQRIMTNWGAYGHYEGSCTSDRCDYTIAFSNLLLALRYGVPVSILRHSRWADAYLIVTVEKGLVTRATYALSVSVPEGYGTRWEREEPQDPGYIPYSSGEYELKAHATSHAELERLCCQWPDPIQHPNYVLEKPSGCEGCLAMFTEFTPQAAASEMQRMTNFNFDCITRWTPCADEQDIMPDAGAESYQQARQRRVRDGRLDRCAYSMSELGEAALNAAIVQVISIPEPPHASFADYPVAKWIKPLGGNAHIDKGKPVKLDASNDSQQEKLIDDALARHKPLILLYPTLYETNTLRIYPCGILPDTEQNEKEVSAAVALGKGLPE